VEFDVEGFAEAGQHESALRTYLDSIRRQYPGATLEVTQRRTRKALGLTRTSSAAIPMERYRKG
jgi:hypothetical protein